MPKLTKQFFESEIESPLSGQRFYRDDDISGFAIRVTPKSKSYIFEKRVDGVNRRITLGKCSEMSLDSAKIKACILLGDIAKGIDPQTGKRINPHNDITLREVLQKFLEIKPIRESTKRNYRFAINRHFKDWLDKPIASTTKDMVEQRHHELTVSPNRLGTSGQQCPKKIQRFMELRVRLRIPPKNSVVQKLYDTNINFRTWVDDCRHNTTLRDQIAAADPKQNDATAEVFSGGAPALPGSSQLRRQVRQLFS